MSATPSSILLAALLQEMETGLYANVQTMPKLMDALQRQVPAAGAAPTESRIHAYRGTPILTSQLVPDQQIWYVSKSKLVIFQIKEKPE